MKIKKGNKMEQINKKAFHDYEVLEKYEVGIVLEGSEVKSIHKGKVNLKGSFCKFFKDELFAIDIHISKFEHENSWSKHDEKRPKKLLLKRKELTKLQSKVQEQGLTLIPLKVYFNDRRKCKIQLGLCKGKKLYDKREDEKEKSIKREIQKDFKFNVK